MTICHICDQPALTADDQPLCLGHLIEAQAALLHEENQVPYSVNDGGALVWTDASTEPADHEVPQAEVPEEKPAKTIARRGATKENK